jgi:hypothetical protein
LQIVDDYEESGHDKAKGSDGKSESVGKREKKERERERERVRRTRNTGKFILHDFWFCKPG